MSDKNPLPQNLLKAIIYGDPGIGKTVLCASALDVPEMNPILALDWEGNMDSIEDKVQYVDASDVLSPIDGKITCVRIENWKEFDEVYTKLIRVSREDYPYKTNIIDSLTALDYWSVDHIVKTNNFKRAIQGVPALEDYRKNFTTLNGVFYQLKNMNAHVLATCQTFLGEGEKDDMIRPALTGQLRQSISGIFKQTIFIGQTEGRRYCRFQPYGKIYAKDCSLGGTLGEKMVDPTMQKIFNRRNGITE